VSSVRIAQLHSAHACVTDLSPILNISGAVNNSEVDLSSGSVVLQCSGDGYPLPTYRWRVLSTNDITDIGGSEYTISSAGEYRVECTASNNVIFANGSRIPHRVSARFYVTGMFVASSPGRRRHGMDWGGHNYPTLLQDHS